MSMLVSVKRYLTNSLAVVLSQIIRLIVGVVVSVYVARYMGPQDFGKLSLALSLTAFLSVFTRLGMESVLVRELVNAPNNAPMIMGTAFYLMNIAGAGGASALVAIIFSLSIDNIIAVFVVSMAVGHVFQSFLVIDYAFQARIFYKYSLYANLGAILCSSALKLGIVFAGQDIVWIGLAFALDPVILSGFLILSSKVFAGTSFLGHYSSQVARQLISEAWPMVVSGIATVGLAKGDQLMIGALMSMDDLGRYSAAARIFEGLVAIAFAVSVAILPVFARIRNESLGRYRVLVTRIFALTIWGGALVAVVLTLFAEDAIVLLFGAEYRAAHVSLAILSWGAIAAAIGFISTRYLIVEGMQRTVAVRNWTALALNVVLSPILIIFYGIEGAAAATAASLFLAHFAFDWINPRLFEMGRLKLRALTLQLNG